MKTRKYPTKRAVALDEDLDRSNLEELVRSLKLELEHKGEIGTLKDEFYAKINDAKNPRQLFNALDGFVQDVTKCDYVLIMERKEDDDGQTKTKIKDSFGEQRPAKEHRHEVPFEVSLDNSTYKIVVGYDKRAKSPDEIESLDWRLKYINDALSPIKSVFERIRDYSQHEIDKENANKDQLTSLYLRRGVSEYFGRNQGKQACVAAIDLDGFKGVNDSHGHLGGDLVLKTIAKYLIDETHGKDLVARLGGDELLVVMTDITEEGARGKLEAIRKYVEGLEYKNGGDKIIVPKGRITLSIGCTFGDLSPTDSEGYNPLMIEADVALYHSKNNGKNKVSVYKELMPESL